MLQRRRRQQEGAGKAGTIIAGLVVLIVLFVAAKMIPMKIKTAELYDFMVDEAEAAADKGADVIRASILKRAEDLDLPLEKKNLEVKTGGDRIRISCQYTVPVDLIVFTYQWRISHEIDRPIFLM